MLSFLIACSRHSFCFNQNKKTTFFSNKISKIRDTFSTSGSFNDTPDYVPPAFNNFKPVTEDEVRKYTMSLLLNLAYWIPYQHSSSGTVLIYSFHLLPSWLITLLVRALFQLLSTLSELRKVIYGIPQGSVLGPSLFLLYTTPLSKIIRLHPHIKFHFYVDDTQLYIHLSHKNASAALARLNACLLDVQRWMSLSKLKLNPEKTEFIVFGSKSQHQKISSYFPVSIFGSLIHPVDSVRNLGVWFDAEFSFSEHVKRTWKACFLQICDLRSIRQYLTTEVAVLAANALVSSRLDYCNSLSGVCHVSIFTNCKVFRIPLLVLLQTIEGMLMLRPF